MKFIRGRNPDDKEKKEEERAPILVFLCVWVWNCPEERSPRRPLGDPSVEVSKDKPLPPSPLPGGRVLPALKDPNKTNLIRLTHRNHVELRTLIITVDYPLRLTPKRFSRHAPYLYTIIPGLNPPTPSLITNSQPLKSKSRDQLLPGEPPRRCHPGSLSPTQGFCASTHETT